MLLSLFLLVVPVRCFLSCSVMRHPMLWHYGFGARGPSHRRGAREGRGLFLVPPDPNAPQPSKPPVQFARKQTANTSAVNASVTNASAANASVANASAAAAAAAFALKVPLERLAAPLAPPTPAPCHVKGGPLCAQVWLDVWGRAVGDLAALSPAWRWAVLRFEVREALEVSCQSVGGGACLAVPGSCVAQRVARLETGPSCLPPVASFHFFFAQCAHLLSLCVRALRVGPARQALASDPHAALRQALPLLGLDLRAFPFDQVVVPSAFTAPVPGAPPPWQKVLVNESLSPPPRSPSWVRGGHLGVNASHSTPSAPLQAVSIESKEAVASAPLEVMAKAAATAAEAGGGNSPWLQQQKPSIPPAPPQRRRMHRGVHERLIGTMDRPMDPGKQLLSAHKARAALLEVAEAEAATAKETKKTRAAKVAAQMASANAERAAVWEHRIGADGASGGAERANGFHRRLEYHSMHLAGVTLAVDPRFAWERHPHEPIAPASSEVKPAAPKLPAANATARKRVVRGKEKKKDKPGARLPRRALCPDVGDASAPSTAAGWAAAVRHAAAAASPTGKAPTGKAPAKAMPRAQAEPPPAEAPDLLGSRVLPGVPLKYARDAACCAMRGLVREVFGYDLGSTSGLAKTGATFGQAFGQAYDSSTVVLASVAPLAQEQETQQPGDAAGDRPSRRLRRGGGLGGGDIYGGGSGGEGPYGPSSGNLNHASPVAATAAVLGMAGLSDEDFYFSTHRAFLHCAGW